MIRSFIFAFILMTCLSIGHVSAAGPISAEPIACKAVFASADTKSLMEPVAWSALPKYKDLPLSPDFVAQLQSHPLTKELRKSFGDGDDFNLNCKFFDSPAQNGWSLQGQFFKKVIQTIFPKAHLNEPHLKQRTLNVELIDSTLLPVPGLPPSFFDMVLLKSVNPGPLLPEKKSLRANLNLPSKAKVVSLYVASGALESGNALEGAIGKLFEDGHADIIILSEQKESNLKMDLLVNSLLRDSSFQIISFLDWPHITPEKGKRYLIVNHARGIMNVLNKAADFAVVVGMGNIYEALQVGTPTYFEREPVDVTRSMFGDTQAWKKMVEQGERTGGGHAFENFQQMFQQIQATSQVPPTVQIYDLPDANGQTPLDRLLLQLQQVLKSQ
jgi:hypothetical protein